jgi:hypothetical protein
VRPECNCRRRKQRQCPRWHWGGYEGKSGVSVGAAVKLDSNVQLNGGVAYGVNDGSVGGRAGVRVGW